MSSVNKAIIVGNLGKDPEIRTLESGDKLASFSVATSESWKDKEGNKKEKTEWHNIVIFGKLAEVAEKYLEKGSKVYIEGKLQTRSWEKDGVTRYSTEILCRNLVMLNTNQGKTSSRQDTAPPISDAEIDDLPF